MEQESGGLQKSWGGRARGTNAILRRKEGKGGGGGGSLSSKENFPKRVLESRNLYATSEEVKRSLRRGIGGEPLQRELEGKTV